MTGKLMKDGVFLKTTFAYKNNSIYAEVKASESKCKVVGNKLYVLPNVPYRMELEGVEVE